MGRAAAEPRAVLRIGGACPAARQPRRPLPIRDRRGFEPTTRALAIVEPLRPDLPGLAAALGEARAFDRRLDARTFRRGLTDALALSVLPGLAARLRTDTPGYSCRIGQARS